MEVVVADDTFIAIKNAGGVEGGAEAEQQKNSDTVRYASPMMQFLSAPHALLTIFYSMLGILIFSALVLHIAVEIRRQHPRHILYGALLILLMAAFLYGSRVTAYSSVLGI